LELHRDGTLKSETDITDLLAQLAGQGYTATVTELHKDTRTESEKFTDNLTDEQVHRLLPTVMELAEQFGIDTAETEYAIEPDFTDLQMTEREEFGLGTEHHDDPQGENGMPASDVPDTITIELPATNVKPEILMALLNSKNSLIETALGNDCAWEHEYVTDDPSRAGSLPLTDLPIEFADGKVKFEWLRFGSDSDAVTAWSAFLAAAVKFSKTAKRVIAKDEGFDEENGKFQFRVFCVKIGLNGAEHKWARKYLLRNLKGSTSFATQESADRWNAKHNPKKTNEEGENDDISE
jgi:hypothetical protein